MGTHGYSPGAPNDRLGTHGYMLGRCGSSLEAALPLAMGTGRVSKAGMARSGSGQVASCGTKAQPGGGMV